VQSLSQVRVLLEQAGVRPRGRLGQCFLIEPGRMEQLLTLAGPVEGRRVLEVGPGTGSLTEELLDRSARVLAVELDARLAALLRERLGGRAGFELIAGDVLAGKHAVSPAVLDALGPSAALVANLPYSIATPLIAKCLLLDWRTRAGRNGARCRIDPLTFTVQEEVADRLAAGPGSASYGPASVLVGVLGRVELGPVLGSQAFWPRPKVSSRMLRIDFDDEAAGRLADVDVLHSLVAASFSQRRKQMTSLLKRKDVPFPPEATRAAMAAADVTPTLRAEAVAPEQFAVMANHLAGTARSPAGGSGIAREP